MGWGEIGWDERIRDGMGQDKMGMGWHRAGWGVIGRALRAGDCEAFGGHSPFSVAYMACIFC